MVNLKEHRSVIIAALANDLIVSRLVSGAKNTLLGLGIKETNIDIIRVSGALEIPLALKAAALSNNYQSFTVLGAVIKGSTDHYDHVARMANDGTLKVAIDHCLALGNGILTVHTLEHALQRADGSHGNLGCSAAKAAFELYEIYNGLK